MTKKKPGRKAGGRSMTDTPNTETEARAHEGLFPVGYCPRKRTDCQALSQIISTDHTSFFCCGENDGTNRTVPQDKYTLCFKNGEIDQISNNDARDLAHLSAVVSGALAFAAEDTDQ
jgi:hypothetical protein